jgi:hypothetical protein
MLAVLAPPPRIVIVDPLMNTPSEFVEDGFAEPVPVRVMLPPGMEPAVTPVEMVEIEVT